MDCKTMHFQRQMWHRLKYLSDLIKYVQFYIIFSTILHSITLSLVYKYFRKYIVLERENE